MKLVPRRYYALLFILFIILEVCAAVGSWEIAGSQVKRQLKSDAYLVGSVLSAPDDAATWSVISGGTPEQYERGAAELERFGYGLSMRPKIHPDFMLLFRHICMLNCGIVLIAYAAFAGCALTLMRKVSRCIDKLSDCVSGDAEPDVHYGVSALDRLSLALHEQYARRQTNGERAILDRRYMKDLLADMSHQLKTPLAGMRMYVELMQRTPDMDADTRARFLDECMKQLERTEWLVQGLLKMARLEAGAVKFDLRPANVDDTLQMAAAPFVLIARESGTELNVNGCGAVFPHDADWLAEAVGNLIKNALEHAPGGHVAVRANATPLTVEISVTDDGEGISMDVLPHLFERFYSRSSAVKSGSVGLGLALAKEIVTQCGGTISVESAPGRGTAFNIVFLVNK